MVKMGYYPDGVTKVTDPLYKCICRDCLFFFFGLMITSKCPECKSDNVFRSFILDEAKAELARLNESKKIKEYPDKTK